MKRTGTVHKSRRGRERDGKQHVRELDAYMTVEASFVIPMALCLIVLTIYLSFYMYNKCVLTQDCARAAIRNAAMKEGNTCPVPPQEEIFRDHYFMADSPSVSAAGGSKVRVTASENMRARRRMAAAGWLYGQKDRPVRRLPQIQKDSGSGGPDMCCSRRI